MIVRNEEGNLPRALSSVRDLVDEIVVVDTGSTDRTLDVARSEGAVVDQIEWSDDFSAARNHSLSMAKGEWILVLDADDEFHPEDLAGARSRVLATKSEAISVRQTILADGDRLYIKEQLSFFRNRPEYRYRFRIHERVFIPPTGVERSPFRIRHHGYLGNTLPEKRVRNGRLLLKMKGDPDPEARVAASWYLGLQYRDTGDNAKALKEFRQGAYSGLASEYRLYSLLGLARLAADIGDGGYARELYEFLLQANPGAVEACLGMAEILLREGNQPEGSRFLKIAAEERIRILPWRDEVWEKRVQACFMASRS